ncbi:unnamed protein product [Arabis nemorensis]|uniref:Uncharacterized protein n=1 Tax=Arabis nemorensis TaxID=586526 RepID=A0A565CUR5_9BRAS|nr:unnamed protein product [Arabis nemorensis]
MLSSVIDDKPVASTWLDRLRLSRGLSTTEDDDASGNPLSLDDFLRRNHHTEVTGDPATSSAASDSPPSAPSPSDPELAESPLDPNPGEWYGVMSDVLSELFNFGGCSSSRSSTIPGKKFPRKQSNPRHCSVESPLDVPLQNQKRDSSFLPCVREFATSSRNSYNKKPAPETRERRRSVAEEDGVDEEEEKGEKDLVGFSRSEVTVIDTSFKIWKSDKLVFRRKNVWKVTDKKGAVSDNPFLQSPVNIFVISDLILRPESESKSSCFAAALTVSCSLGSSSSEICSSSFRDDISISSSLLEEDDGQIFEEYEPKEPGSVTAAKQQDFDSESGSDQTLKPSRLQYQDLKRQLQSPTKKDVVSRLLQLHQRSEEISTEMIAKKAQTVSIDCGGFPFQEFNPRYHIEEVHDDPESSNVNIFLSRQVL